MKLDPKIIAVHDAARALVAALDARERLEARCRRELPIGMLSRDQAKAMLASVLDHETTAFNELLRATYDDVILDRVCAGEVR